MTHELKEIIQQYEKRKPLGDSAVLATVVALDGSSYRRPGVRMLIFKNGDMVGAVSGGCVEKEVLRQSEAVFKTGISKIMVYDGRFRLGCEGVLYILLEVFNPSKDFLNTFWETIRSRKSFVVKSTYEKGHGENKNYNSTFYFDDAPFSLHPKSKTKTGNLESFEQTMQPCFRLMILGAEHDAVQLCKYAVLTGWEVTVVANPKEEKSIMDFPGASTFLAVDPETFCPELDHQTAVAIMTHSYVKDLQFLIGLKNADCAYIGLLGPFRRREKLFGELLERYPDISEEYLEQIHGPAGIDIGAETPQEIAISILSEILSVTNKKEPSLLKHKMGKIHM